MKQFSIYSPVLGKREDVPGIFLPKSMTPDALNCQYWNGKVRTSYGREQELADASTVAVQVPDAQPILKYHLHQTDSSSKYLLAFTALHVYKWDTTNYEWDTFYTCSTTDTVKNWSVASINGKVVATNNVDAPIRWDGQSTTMSLLNAAISDDGTTQVTISRAKCCIEYEGHIVFGNYSLSNAVDYENGIIMSDLDNEEEWILDGNTDASSFFAEGAGVVNGFGLKADLLYVFKTRSIRIFWYTGTSSIMNSRAYTVGVGTFAPDSIGNDADGNLYFLGSDLSFREVDLGRISEPVKNTIRNINHESDVINIVQFTYIPEYNEIWWACPVNGEDTNNIILCYQYNNIWYERDTPVSAFGVYERTENSTWDDEPDGATWDDWTGIWNDGSEAAGWQSDICSDYYGYTYRVHASSGDKAWNGSAIASTRPVHRFVMSTDLGDKGALRYFKRLLYMYAYFTNLGGSAASIYIKEDNAKSWTLAGTIATTGEPDIYIGELPLDYRARHFLIKVESTSQFEFLGAEFEYLDSGLR